MFFFSDNHMSAVKNYVPSMMDHSFSFFLRKKMDYLEMLVKETMGVFLMKELLVPLCV